MSDETPRRLQPSASYSFTMRLRMPQHGATFAGVAHAIAETDAMLGAIDLVRVESNQVVRDVTVACGDGDHAEAVVRAVRDLEGVQVDSVSDRTFLMHKGGKIEVVGKLPLKTRDDLSMAYTPGVARVCMAIHEDRAKAWALTIKGNTVAVVSDGTAVLGLGDIGPEAAMPVMEGKAMLFKEFAGVDAFPLCLDTKDVDEIVAFVKAAAPTFGGINLEDISAPRCFEIERRLREELDIPVFHDDQHGTAIVVLAALLNALRLVGKRPEDVTVVVVGAGAAGVACTEIMLAQGVGDVIVCNREGALYAGEAGAGRRARGAGRAHQQARRARDRGRGAGRRRRGARAVRPGRDHGGRRAHDGRRRDRLRDGQPGARGPARGGRRGRRGHGHRPLGLPEPDQQRARLPGRVPRRAGRARDDDQRGDEARRRAGDRRGHPARTSCTPTTSSRACSTAGWRSRWPRRWPPRRWRAGWRGASTGRPTEPATPLEAMR